MNFHIYEFSKDRYRGKMSRQESPNMTCKHSSLSNEGGRGTPSSNETPRTSEIPISVRHSNLGGEASDQRKSIQMRRLFNESVNRSSRQSAKNSAMDATFLDRLYINNPTPENVGNPSHQQNMFGNFLLFLYFFVYLCLCFICFCFFLMFYVFVKYCN